MRNAEKILFFAAGAGIGAGVVFLFGTREGRQYRRQVARAMEDGCERVTEAGRDALDEVLEKGKELMDGGKEFLEEAGTRVGRQLRFAQK